MIEDIIKNMGAKLGESNDLIADDIASLINYENENNEVLATKDKEINDLKSRNETLTKVNANLLKSIPLSNEKIEEPIEEKQEFKEISFRDCFDNNGNFIR